MIRVEIILLTNNIIKPFQNFHKRFNLDFIESNKLFITKSLAEHGLGFLINIYELKDLKRDSNGKLIKKIIFDTGGPNLTFLYNSSIMGYQLNDINIIILSHWHYDHTGAFYNILQKINHKIPIICHESARFERFFIRSDDIKNSDLYGKSKSELSVLLNQSKIVNQEAINLKTTSELNGDVKFLSKDFNVLQLNEMKIIVSGEIPRNYEDEDFTNFYSIQNSKKTLQIDKILDDKALILEFEDNIILLNGCCHSGLKNTLTYVKSKFNKPISHIIGGFHMVNTSDDRINNTIKYLTEFQEYNDILYLFPIHCSGDRFSKELERKNISNIKRFNVSVGTKFIFNS